MPLQTLGINTIFYITLSHFPFQSSDFCAPLSPWQRPAAQLQPPFPPPLSLSLRDTVTNSKSPWQPNRDSPAQHSIINPHSLAVVLSAKPSCSQPPSLSHRQMFSLLSFSHSVTPSPVSLSSRHLKYKSHQSLLKSSSSRSPSHRATQSTNLINLCSNRLRFKVFVLIYQ